MHPTEKNKIVIDEEVAPVVRRIFALALSGVSCRSIAALLNREGVPTPAAYANLPVARPGPYTGLWSSERISDMLQNETYMGNIVQGRSVKISYKSKKCLRQDPANWVVVEGTHEPLVDAETFRKVRLLVNSRKHTRSRTYDFLLKGLIFSTNAATRWRYSTARTPPARIGCSSPAGLYQGRRMHLSLHQGRDG